MARTVGDVILHLHQSAIDPARWPVFLESARVLAGADYASIVFRHANASFHEGCVMGCGNQAAASDISSLQAILNRCELPYDGLTSEQPYALDAILALGRSRKEFTDYLTNRALIDTIVVRVSEPKGGNAWLTLGRSRQRFDHVAADFLSRIASHLRVATQTLATLAHERTRADVAADAMKRLGLGWISFDAQGRVVELDGPIESLFGRVVCGRPLRLVPSAQTTLRDVIAGLALDPCAAPRAIRLNEARWLDLVMVPITYRASSRGATAVAVGYVRAVADDLADRGVELARLFQLTSGEARLAMAITRGRSIGEAAAELNLSIETARTYSKRLYAKTGTKGQADLVRTILSGVLALT